MVLLLAAALVVAAPPEVEEVPAALAWAVPSFALHVAIHEGAHAVAALAAGGQVTRFQPYPTFAPGPFAFGGMAYRGAEQADLAIRVAPAAVEVAWLISAAVAYRARPSPVLRGFLLTEMVASLVDLAKWWASSFSRTGDAYGVPFVIPLGAVLVPVAAGVAALIAFSP